MQQVSRYSMCLIADTRHRYRALTRLTRATTSSSRTRKGTVSSSRRGQTGDTKPTKSTSCTYLHVAPDGDWWTGTEIFAAKHLQPDYVRSVVVPPDIDIDEYLESIEDDAEQNKILRKIYDDKRLPDGMNATPN
mmetsp:Transcript_19561/g.39622  ORF Transcript_19561/g.39622 Transcript_19561/m.39622 type:complete len:134 (-) Transcript_19561:533-934(-)